MSTMSLPPLDTTTAILHFLTPCYGSTQNDETFTVKGQREGAELGDWLKSLIAEYECPELDCTIWVYHHTADGRFESTEVTHCRR